MSERDRLNSALNEIDARLRSRLDFDEIMQCALEDFVQALGADAGDIKTRSEGGGWTVAYQVGFRPDDVEAHLDEEDAPIAERIYRTAEPVVVPDYSRDPEAYVGFPLAHKLTATLAVPLIVKDEVVGALFAQMTSGPREFTPAEVDFSCRLATSASLALENARLFEAVRESGERLADVLNSMDDAFIAMDDDWCVTLINPRAAEMLGRARSDLEGHSLRDLYPDLPTWPVYERVKATGVPETHEVASPVMNSWIEVRAFRTSRGVSVVFADVSQRKEIEEALRESEERYRDLVEQTVDGIFVADEQGRYVDSNSAGAQMLGYSVDEIRTLTLQDVLDPNELERLPAQMSTLARGAVVVNEWRFRRKDGSTFVGELVGRQLPGDRMQGILRDITERKAAEEALRESEERVRHKLDAILTPEGDISELDLADIIDVEAIQALMDQFYEISQVPMSIIDLKGNVLIGVGWQKVCLEFHRAHPETCKYCEESDAELTMDVARGDVKLYKCKNGMWDMVTPIFIGDEKVGNLFSGQFFFDDEEPDQAFFSAQARRFGFDAQTYLAAVNSVPRLSRKTVERGTEFLTELSNLLSKLSFSNVKLAGSLAERDALTESLQSSRDELARAQAVGHIGSWRLDTRTNVLAWSEEVHRLFDVPAGEALTYESFLASVHPDDRAYVDEQWAAALRGATYDIEHRIVVGDCVKWVREHAELEFAEGGELLGGFGIVQDITGRKTAELALQAEAREIEVANRLIELFVEEDTAQLFDKALDVLLEVTDSTQGVFGYMDEVGDLVCPTMTRVFDECEMSGDDKCVVYKQHTWTGLWGRSIREQALLASNEPTQVPAGHVPIENNLAAPIVFQDKTIGMVNLANKNGSYSEDDTQFVRGLSQRIAPVLYAWMQRDLLNRERETAAGEVSERRHLAEKLNQIAAEVSATFEQTAIHEALAAYGSELLAADFGVALTCDRDLWIVSAAAGAAPVAVGDSFRAEELGGTAADRQAVYHIPDTTADVRLANTPLLRLGVCAIHAIPIVLEGTVRAWLAYGHTREIGEFSEAQVEFADRLMSVAKVALQSASVYQREHRIAETLQDAILAPPEDMPGLAISYLYRPASAAANVGGDFYDVFELAEGRAALLVGDVSGKGLEAARLTSLVRDGVRAYLLEDAPPHEVFQRLNRLAFRFSPVGQFATAFIGVLDVTTGSLEYCGAGHPSALIVTKDGCGPLGSQAALIGAFDSASYESQDATLGLDDVLVLYTDGVTEARRGTEFYGETRLVLACERLRGVPVAEMPQRLLDDVLEFSDGELRDDVIVLCIQRTPRA